VKHLLSAAALVPALLLAQPALAQADDDKVNQLIVYGDDECPQSTDNQITVCARKPESERYRIPEPLRESNSSPQNDAWNNKVIAYEAVGKTGTLSCSPVGGGGFTGCFGKFIDAAYAEKDADPSIRFGELIAAERARRLATIDADAAVAQAQVEQAEKEYEARERARQDPGATAEPAPAAKP